MNGKIDREIFSIKKCQKVKERERECMELFSSIMPRFFFLILKNPCHLKSMKAKKIFPLCFVPSNRAMLAEIKIGERQIAALPRSF